ncbi:MAG: AAA family ATPase [Pirellulales bacterium]|nr:AAA family ATPase [Pirellulales bacterium]
MFRWLEWESAAEADELAERRKLRTRKTAEQSGETLIDLAIEDHQTGLAGRHLFTFVKRNRTCDLPWNRLRIGSPVVVTPVGDDEEPAQNGVVSARSQHSIQVAFEHWISGKLFDLDLSADEVTRNRERAALARASEVRGRQLELRQILLGDLDPIWGHNRRPRFRGEPPPLVDVDHLNPSQCEAIQFALTAEDVAIIHGPPGTGKTTSVVAFIRQAISRGESVLACAPSNTAVDNLLERLVAAEERVVRLGHPARVKEALRNHTLDGLVEAHDNMRVARNLLRRAEQLFEKADRYTRARPVPGSKYEMRQEAKRLKHEARQLERRAIFDVLAEADVICATNTIDEEVLGDREFDWVVVDEACQCTEPATWIPLLRGKRVLLAGDHCQLPPTVRSIPAAEEGYSRSMMQRLVETYRTAITRQLIVQYRMHEEIMQFSSEQFYGGTLEADDSVRRHVLADLPHVAATPLSECPVTFVDTAGADYDEELEPDGLSRRNPSEGRLVLAKARQLIEAGLSPREIAVIAPYAAQVRWLRQHAEHRALEIDTVDGFQGREKEAVIISLVRSNREGEIGFLGDTRRMNVALTRARRKLIVIGDSATLGHHPFYANMLDYFQTTESYHTVWEEDM